MAWNIPGGSKDGRPPRRQGGALERLLDPLRGLAGDGGGIGRWIALAVVLWLVLSTFVLVTEQQRGVVLRFGQFVRVMQPGPNFKWPWPVERVYKVNATQSNSYSDKVPVLTRDLNMVSVDVNVQYKIGDPTLYLFGSRNAEDVLKEAAQSAVREAVGRSDMDTVLFARGPLTATVKERLQKALDEYRTGLTVTELNLPDARYPDEVKDAFDEAQRASQDKNTSINQAEAYAKQVVPEARGKATSVRTEAEGYRTAAIARATGDAQRFTLLLEQYKAAPEVTRKRLWLETVQQVLAENRKVVGGDGRQLVYVPMPAAPAANAGATAPPQVTAPDLVAPPVTSTPDIRPERSARPTGREEPSR
ncbi:MAG: FtsH protease activity modulator HflK [Lysobacteraceae bacterium]